MENATLKRVLVLEDEEMLRLIVKDFLTVSGFETQAFADALSAIEILKNKAYDVAIVDINMPQMSGEEFIIQAKTLCPDIQFIIHTGHSCYNVSSRLKEIGVSQNNVLIKPVENMNVFVTKIQQMCLK